MDVTEYGWMWMGTHWRAGVDVQECGCIEVDVIEATNHTTSWQGAPFTTKSPSGQIVYSAATNG